MAITDVVDQYFTYEGRLASFQTAQQLSKRRASNASSKTPKPLKWPHKFLSAEELAKAGFFYYPLLVNPDNVACFLCHKSLDGWEKDDDPLAEHLKHSPSCGWAIVATIEKQDGDLSQEYPCSARMIEARKATFADKWPHESKKGWKCKIKQLVDAGWKYTPTPEYDDMATCTYCSLALDGWEPSDKPLDEHFKRSPECAFFTLINDYKQSPAAKRTKAKRTSKASRLSTQSTFTVASDAPSLGDLPAEDEDSVLTTATNATITKGGKKMGKSKKGAAKGKKTRTKKGEAVEVAQPAPEPEDDDFEVKVDVAPKANRGRKRKSEHVNDTTSSAVEVEEAPPAKRRATRTRGSMAVDNTVLGPTDGKEYLEPAPKPSGKRVRQSTKSTRKASAASAASLRAGLPNDDEIDQALQADLDRQLSDEENEPAVTTPHKKATRASKITKADRAMFDTESMDIDEVAIEAELEAMEQDSKALPKAKATKGKQPRKVSAKQQAAARKAAEAEAEAERLAEEEASQQIAAELEHSIAIHHSSPIVQPKRQTASSRQPSQQVAGRGTRASVMSTSDNNVTLRDGHQVAADDKGDSGNESDASMASQSTVVRGGSTRRGSTLKKGKAGKKAASRNIEEIVHKAEQPKQDATVFLAKTQESIPAEETSMTEDRFYTPAPEATQPVQEEPIPKVAKAAKTVKPKGRPAKEAPAAPAQELLKKKNAVQEPTTAQSKAKAKIASQPPRSPTPPPKEMTPSQSPQSSDAENHPPSSKPSATTKKASTPHSNTKRVPRAATPVMSPSKRNIIAGLQTLHPWTTVDLDAIFLMSPSDENATSNGKGLLGDAMDKAKNGQLTSPEKKMSVEEWIHYNAEVAEEKLRGECERMVGTFEGEGTRAMRALEGVECAE